MALDDKVKRQLYFESGGYCMNPSCNRELYVYYEGENRVNISDLAHIIGQSMQGPRGESELNIEERDSADNILLLCKNCHKMIDTNINGYPVELLHDWKTNHLNRIRDCFITPVFKNRKEARSAINRMIVQNKVIFEQYGPYSLNYNPLSDVVYEWNRKCVEILIPNNKKIINILDRNNKLLNDEEYLLLEKFREHSIEFEYNKISGNKNPHAPTYPKGFDDILKED